MQIKLPSRLVLGLSLLVSMTACANTFQGAQRDMNKLLSHKWPTTEIGSSSSQSASAKPAAAEKQETSDEWVDPR
ncbi:MAG: hypothetical protein AAF637_04945 [Pseudomonadota bacterium]